MKINFTKREYRTLVELLYLGEWMLDSHDTKPNPETAHYRQLCQKVYSYFKEMGCEDQFEEYRGELFSTREIEDRMQELVQKYDNDSFWQELISRLGERDALAEFGPARLAAMDGFERVRIYGEKEDPWFDEIEEHGIERLGVLHSEG